MSEVQPDIVTLYTLIWVPLTIFSSSTVGHLFAHCWVELGGRKHSQKMGVPNE
jgi:hypothetical protein